MELRELVGVNIRKLRNDRQMSQEELAFQAELDRSYLSEIENGYKSPGIEMLAKISKALGVKLASLFAGYDD
jgi:transcriptional regulator with XRE-family HTH domain